MYTPQVIQSDYFAYNNHGDNLTLQQFQSELVQSLQKCASPDNNLGHTLHVVAGKGDWKWRVEWLRQVRYYNNKQIAGPAAGLCPRCLCTRDTWLDVHERFNAPADLATARLTAVGDIALKSLPGWEPEMEVPDLLHVLWTGTGRDLIGSLCLQIVETSASYTGSTYDAIDSGGAKCFGPNLKAVFTNIVSGLNMQTIISINRYPG